MAAALAAVRGMLGFTVVALVAIGCGGGSTASAPDAGGVAADFNIDVTEADYSLKLSQDTVGAGTIQFRATNASGHLHELVLFKTDLSVDDLPKTDDGDVDEEGEGIEHVDSEIEDLGEGETRSMTVTLTPGRYLAACNLPGHFMKGMVAPLTVE